MVSGFQLLQWRRVEKPEAFICLSGGDDRKAQYRRAEASQGSGFHISGY
jgi:hypothetical protein